MRKPTKIKQRPKAVTVQPVVGPVVDMHTELKPLMDASFATACRGFKLASARFTSDAPLGDERYAQGVALMNVGNETMSKINDMIRPND